MLGLCRWSELRHAGVAAMPLCHDSYSAGILAAKWGSKPGTAATAAGQDRDILGSATVSLWTCLLHPILP